MVSAGGESTDLSSDASSSVLPDLKLFQKSNSMSTLVVMQHVPKTMEQRRQAERKAMLNDRCQVTWIGPRRWWR